MVWLALFLITIGFSGGASGLKGQVQPAPADTLRPDTVLVPIPPEEISGDTIPAALREAAAARQAPPEIPSFPQVLPPAWAAGRWVWGRPELSAMAGFTLLEFIERLPGVARFRAGGFGRPEGVAALGMGGARVRVLLDGFELDPIGAGAFELETLPLQDVDRIVVERSLSELRVEVRTFRLDQPEPQSTVELGTGVYQTRLLRALFSRGIGSRSIATGVFDLVSTRGIAINEPYSHSSSVFRWSYSLADPTALQVEWRRTALDREGEIYPRQTARSDLLLRGRSVLPGGVVLDGTVGRTTWKESAVPEDPEARRIAQGAIRAGYAMDGMAADLSFRLRRSGDSYPLLPTSDMEARFSFAPHSLIRVEGSARRASGEQSSATGARLTGVLGPASPFSIFGSLELGSRLVPIRRAGSEIEAAGSAALSEVAGGGWRGGLSLLQGSMAIEAAIFGSGVSAGAPFGLPFDSAVPLMAVEPLNGIEARLNFSLPPLQNVLHFEGWYARYDGGTRRPYTPNDLGRAALIFHGLYYGSQLEPRLRVEVVHRGQARVPLEEPASFGALTPGYQSLDVSLDIRIIDVTMFLLWSNLLGNRLAIDLPGSPPAAPRIVYGAEWQFRN